MMICHEVMECKLMKQRNDHRKKSWTPGARFSQSRPQLISKGFLPGMSHFIEGEGSLSDSPDGAGL